MAKTKKNWSWPNIAIAKKKSSWPSFARDQRAFRVKSCSHLKWRLLVLESTISRRGEDKELKNALGGYVKQNLRRIEL